MKGKITQEVEIVEFKKDFEDEVVNLVGRELRSWKVIPQSDKPVTDADLYNIPKLYSARSRFWVALRNGGVIGTVGIRELGKKRAKLKRMFVLDQYHGTGIGQMLLDKALTFARKQGYKEVILNSHYLFTRSHRFYEKNGFVFQGKKTDRLRFKLRL